jgi:hypothetical protein
MPKNIHHLTIAANEAKAAASAEAHATAAAAAATVAPSTSATASAAAAPDPAALAPQPQVLHRNDSKKLVLGSFHFSLYSLEPYNSLSKGLALFRDLLLRRFYKLYMLFVNKIF